MLVCFTVGSSVISCVTRFCLLCSINRCKLSHADTLSVWTVSLSVYLLAVVTEAQKCLSNLVFNSKAIQRLCCVNSCIPGLMCRLKTFRDPEIPHIVKYFDMRLLFLLTAFCGDIRLVHIAERTLYCIRNSVVFCLIYLCSCPLISFPPQ